MEIEGEDTYYTTKEAYTYIRKSYSTLRRYVVNGLIPEPYRRGTKMRWYLKSDLDSLIKTNLEEDDHAIFVRKQVIDRDLLRLRKNIETGNTWARMDYGQKQLYKREYNVLVEYSAVLKGKLDALDFNYTRPFDAAPKIAAL